MPHLMQTILLLSLCGIATALVLAGARRLLKNKLPHALFYYLWLLVLLRFIVPVALPLPEAWRPHQTQALPAPVETVSPPSAQTVPSDVLTQPVNPSYPQTDTPPAHTGTVHSGLLLHTSQPWHARLWAFLCAYFVPLWLIGAAVHLLWFALSYLRFCRSLKRDAAPLLEHEQALLDHLRGRQTVTACRSPLAGTPMLVGLLHHRIVLPDTSITTRQLEYILRHELTHLRRRDLLFKWLTVAVTSLHWFNPLMPWLRREIARCCELSCDEAVIGTLTEEQKQWYGETLLSLAALHALPRAVPATTLCEEKTQLRERLISIMKHKKATALILLLSCLLAVLIAGCAAVLGPQEPVVEGPDTSAAEEKAPWVPAASADSPVYHWLYWGDRGEMDMMIENDGAKAYAYSGASLQETPLTEAQRKQNPQPGLLTVGEMETYKSIVDSWISEYLPLTGTNYHVVYVTDRDTQRYFLAESQGVWSLSLADNTIRPVAGKWEQGNYQGCFAVYEDGDVPSKDKRFWTLLPNDGSIPLAEETSLAGKVAVLTTDSPLENASVETVDEKGNNILMDMALTLPKGTLVYVESHDSDLCTVTLLAGEPPRVQGQLDVSLLSIQQTDLENANQVILKNAKMWLGDPDEGVFSDSICTGVANVETQQDDWYSVTLPGGGDPFWVRREDIIFTWPLPEPLPVWLPTEADLEADITRWSYAESQGQIQISILEVSNPPAHLAWHYDMHSGTMAERTARSTRYAGRLKVSQLPGVLNGLKTWLDENEPLWQTDRTLTSVHQPPSGYKRNFPEDETLLVYSLADGQVAKLEGDYTGSEDYGLLDITVNGIDADKVYHLFIDDQPTVQPAPVLSGRRYYYEGGGFSGVGDFTLNLYEDGTFGYYEGLLSSHLGMGNWTMEGDTLTLREDTFSRVFRFRIQDGSLYYIKKSSSPFTYVELEDGARFLENT